jgi:hypothetical protein
MGWYNLLKDRIGEGIDKVRFGIGKIFVGRELDGLEKEVLEYKEREDDLILRAVEAVEETEQEKINKGIVERDLILARKSHRGYIDRIFELQNNLEKSFEDFEDLKSNYNLLDGDAKTSEALRLVAEQDRDRVEDENRRHLKYSGHYKETVRKSREIARESGLRFKDARLSLVSLYNQFVGLGINPKTEEGGGRYAFVNAKGNITSMSRKAQRSLGYEPGEISYKKIIPYSVLSELGEVEKELILPELKVKTKRIGNPLKIKNVKISPMRTRGVYLGSVIDFQELGRLERVREYIFERRKRNAKERARKIVEFSEDMELKKI